MDITEKQLDYHQKMAVRRFWSRILILIFLGSICTGLIIGGFIFKIPEENLRMIDILTGSVTTAFFGTAVGYYFGDSESRSDGGDSHGGR